MDSKIILVTGGARSGKSVFAEQYCAACPGRHGYIATAQVQDEEMAARIAAHRRRRPADWQTFEVPWGLSDTVDRIWQQTDVVLLDCLTLYFSNYLFAHEREADGTIIEGALAEMTAILDKAARQQGKTLVLVTNELGCGIVPMGRVSRVYRDLIGRINQLAAKRSQQVYLTVSGITMEIKSQMVKLPVPGDEA
ncbi:MAG: bifunctional adenosylcobinamide kinase/adenosylcobinamide-phosphate guanylyltransferase [Megasphaera sp.]|jgi:adenosylcobinamide kinase/adenosylcobinamide-phosphate guanylyltransferase|nr:bifunctional adenosylcobinamide kinase/adenosylcobinamide-phosphate guanylyltransferase [Megasphaera sp.]